MTRHPGRQNPSHRHRFSNTSRFHNKISKTGYKLYVSEQAQAGIDSAGSYDRMKINQKIQSLASIPRPEDAGLRIGATDVYRIAVGHYRFDYVIHSGEITIAEVSLDPVNADNAKNEKPGLYRIARGGNNTWGRPKLVKKINTSHAAVNGMQNDLNKASELMPKHVEHAFGDQVKEFTLFHNPSTSFFGDLWESNRDKMGITTPLAKQLAAILKDVQDDGRPVQWVVHSQGGLIFSQAVNYHNRTWGTSLHLNTVQFHSGANNAWLTQKILKKAGISKLGQDNNQPYDLVPAVVGMNTLNPVRLVGSVLASPALSDAGPLKHFTSPHTLPNKRENWKFWQWAD